MTLIGLVLVANTTFAQGGTALLPNTGEVYTYTVDGLTDADTYTFVVNQSSSDFTAAQNAGDGTSYILPGTLTGNPSGNEASIQIEWLAAGTYYLWIQLIDEESSCENYRFVEITVTNNLDFEIYAAAIGDGVNVTVDDIDDEDITGLEDCSVLDPGSYEWDDTDGSSSNGSTWVYYRIVRTGGSTSAWTFDFGATNGGGTNTVDGYFGSADGSSWSDISGSLNDISVAGTQDVYYIRVNIAQAADLQLITGTASDGKETQSGNEDSDGLPDAVNAGFTIEETPTIGNFSY